MSEEHVSALDMKVLARAFAAFFGPLPMAVSLKDRDLRYVAANEAMGRLLGRRSGELAGLRQGQVAPQVLPDLEAAERRLLEQGTAFKRLRLELEPGKGQVIELRCVPGPDGEPAGVLSRLENGVENNDREAALAEERDKERRVSLAKSSFLASVSHEIRTSLTGIMGMTDLALNTGLTDEQQDYLHMVRQSADVLQGLLNDIMDLSKIEAGKLEMSREPFDLTGILDYVQRSFEAQARRKYVELNSSMDRDVPRYVTGDAKRLRQVLVNLTSNAVKFTDRGEVAITVSMADSKERCQGRDCLRFTVRDTGFGIPKERQAELFTAYSQIAHDKNRGGKGFGLGLAISRQLVELMGGRISVDSTPGKGSSFSFTMPLIQATEQQVKGLKADSPEPGKQAEGKAKGVRILLAEDNEVNRLFALNVLRNKGYEVRAVNNGREVLEQLPKERFNLVLMDVQMPEMDGIEATRAVRADTSGAFDPDIPIVALTAHAMRGDRERFLAEGMNEYVAKPLRIEELTAVIDAVLGGKDAASAPEREPEVEAVQNDSEPVVELEKTLARLKGDKEFLAELYATFLEDLDSRMARFASALDQGDAKSLQKLAHSLKGAASTIDAGQVRAQAFAVENAARDEDMATAKKACGLLSDRLQALKQELGNWLREVGR